MAIVTYMFLIVRIMPKVLGFFWDGAVLVIFMYWFLTVASENGL